MRKVFYAMECDGCSMQHLGLLADTPQESRRWAREDGWKVPYRSAGRLNNSGRNNKDLCPECQ